MPKGGLNQEQAADLIGLFGPDEGGLMLDAVLAEQHGSNEQPWLSQYPIQEAEAESTSYSSCSYSSASQYSHVWMEAMAMDYDELWQPEPVLKFL